MRRYEADAAVNDVHRIDLPRLVLIGKGVLEHLGEVSEELEIRRALIVTGRKTYGIAGERARAILRESGVNAEVVYVSEADIATVEHVKNRALELQANAVIGVGGGRTIDVAKLSAAESKTSFLSVPTTASHDGIASSLASIKGLGRPYSVKAKAPVAVIADSNIIAESPHRYTASGCGDVIAKAVAVRDWRLSHELNSEYYGEYAGSLALMSSDMIMKTAPQIRDRLEAGYRTLLEALVSCGVAMSIAGSSRPCSGSEHLFSHALDMIAPKAALHGEQCGVGTIMMAKLYDLDWHSVACKLKMIGAPTTARELGVSRDMLVNALTLAGKIRPERYTILNEVNLTEESAEKLAEECGVI